ncbi:hypothetical protein M5K25_002398 [Dendrobium thyrsiflorum]|uniref:Cysteine-rich transmembrane domain-containing protein n=1 Tax=Dendrobium thyrsiflorum TaxID=117978 RepID=A0ABD0VML7_DENTH
MDNKPRAKGTKAHQYPPVGYPMESSAPPKKKCYQAKTKKRGEKGFIEGCLAGLCCCWICEECCT